MAYLPLGDPDPRLADEEPPDLATKTARAVDAKRYPGRWANYGHRRGRAWVPDYSDQYLRPAVQDQVFEPGEVTEIWEAARLEILNRRPWLRFLDEYVTRIALELEKGPRPQSAFPKWLKPLLAAGLYRLRHEGYLVQEEKPNIWYRGRGKPIKYLVTVYSLKPEPRRTYEKTGT